MISKLTISTIAIIAAALSGCRTPSSSSSTDSDPAASNSPGVSLSKLGLFTGNTSQDGSGEKCHIFVHGKTGSDWSVFGFGGIKSLTVKLSANLLVPGKIDLTCLDGPDSLPHCSAYIGDHYLYVNYQPTKNMKPRVNVWQRGQDGELGSLLASCWHLTKASVILSDPSPDDAPSPKPR